MPSLMALFLTLLKQLSIWVIFLSPCPFLNFLKCFKMKFFRKEKQVRHEVSGWVLKGRLIFNLVA